MTIFKAVSYAITVKAFLLSTANQVLSAMLSKRPESSLTSPLSLKTGIKFSSLFITFLCMFHPLCFIHLTCWSKKKQKGRNQDCLVDFSRKRPWKLQYLPAGHCGHAHPPPLVHNPAHSHATQHTHPMQGTPLVSWKSITGHASFVQTKGSSFETKLLWYWYQAKWVWICSGYQSKFERTCGSYISNSAKATQVCFLELPNLWEQESSLHLVAGVHWAHSRGASWTKTRLSAASVGRDGSNRTGFFKYRGAHR